MIQKFDFKLSIVGQEAWRQQQRKPSPFMAHVQFIAISGSDITISVL